MHRVKFLTTEVGRRHFFLKVEKETHSIDTNSWGENGR